MSFAATLENRNFTPVATETSPLRSEALSRTSKFFSGLQVNTQVTALDEEDILGIFGPPQPPYEPRIQRRWPRSKIKVRIEVTVCVDGCVETIPGQGDDISEGGMATYISADLQVNDTVSVEIVQMYGKPRLSFAARVSNRNGFRYGLEFVDVSDENRSALAGSIMAAQ